MAVSFRHSNEFSGVHFEDLPLCAGWLQYSSCAVLIRGGLRATVMHEESSSVECNHVEHKCYIINTIVEHK